MVLDYFNGPIYILASSPRRSFCLHANFFHVVSVFKISCQRYLGELCRTASKERRKKLWLPSCRPSKTNTFPSLQLSTQSAQGTECACCGWEPLFPCHSSRCFWETLQWGQVSTFHTHRVKVGVSLGVLDSEFCRCRCVFRRLRNDPFPNRENAAGFQVHLYLHSSVHEIAGLWLILIATLKNTSNIILN